MNLVLTLCDPGDTVVMFLPYYFNAYMAYQMTGVTDIVLGPSNPVTFQPDAGSSLDTAFLATCFGNGTSAGLLCIPCNFLSINHPCPNTPHILLPRFLKYANVLASYIRILFYVHSQPLSEADEVGLRLWQLVPIMHDESNDLSVFALHPQSYNHSLINLMFLECILSCLVELLSSIM